MKKKKPFPLSGVGIVLLGILILFSGFTAAKYMHDRKEEPLFAAKSFYFESDLLKSAQDNTVYTLQEGADEILFTLKNYPDKLRRSEVDIEANVVLSKDAAEIEKKTVNFSKGNAVDVPVKFSDLQAGTYIVTATSEKPYRKVLQAAFVVTELDEELGVVIGDGKGSSNLVVTITTVDYEGLVKIEWPEGILPDNTDPYLKGITENNCIVKMEKHSEYTFRFFKTNPESDNKNSIEVTKVTS